MKCRFCLCLFFFGLATSITHVNVGYFADPAAHLAAIDMGLTTFEDYKFHFYPQSGGGGILDQFDDEALDLAGFGSTPFCQGMARQIDIAAIFIEKNIVTTEGLIVRKGVITTPRDLYGKHIATISGSTAHYHLLILLEMFDFEEADVVLHLASSVAEIMTLWNSGQIDGNFAWGDAITVPLNDGTGYMLVPSGYLNNWARPIYNVFAGRRSFLDEHPRAASYIVSIYSAMQINQMDPEFVKDWLPGAAAYNYTYRASFLEPVDVSDQKYTKNLKQTLIENPQLTTETQIEWFLPGGLTEFSLQETVAFLYMYKSLYEPFNGTITDFYDGQFVNSTVGEFSIYGFSNLSYVGYDETGAAAPNSCSGFSDIAAASGWINCTGSVASTTTAEWRVEAGSVTRLSITSFWMLTDFTVIDQDGNLLLSLKGRKMHAYYMPTVRAIGPVNITATFKPDGSPFRAYTNNGSFISEQGFELAYDAQECTNAADCDNHGTCSSGVCTCDTGYFGSDCSFAYCIGTKKFTAVSGAIQHGSNSTYQNNARCVWEIVPSDSQYPLLTFTEFKVETGNDKVYVYDGVGSNKTLLAALTGSGIPSPIAAPSKKMTVEFVSDSRGRRKGFTAEYATVASLDCTDDDECKNGGTCSDGVCYCQPGYYGRTCLDVKCSGTQVLTSMDSATIKPQVADTYSSNFDANCGWTFDPPVSSEDGQTATGARIDILAFDLEKTVTDKIVIEDALGTALDTYIMSDWKCQTQLDCPTRSSSDCNNVTHACVCKPGFFNTDCTLESPLVINKRDITVRFYSDKSNRQSGLEGIKLNYSAIYPCSYNCYNHGTCNNVGVCECDRLWEGKFCQTEIIPAYVTSGVSTGISVLGAIILLYGLVLFGLLMKNRKHPTIKATNYIVTVVASVFLLILNAAAIFPLLKPSKVACALRWWGIVLPLSGFLACIFAKNWRLYRSLTMVSKSLSVGFISNSYLAGVISIFILAMIVELAICEAVSPTKSIILMDTEEHDGLSIVCTGGKIFPFVVIPTMATVLVFGIYICIRTKDMPTQFVDVKMMAICIYNTFFCGLILVPVDVLNSGSTDAQAIVRSMGVLLVCFVGFSALILSKILRVLKPEEETGFRIGANQYVTRPSDTSYESTLGSKSTQVAPEGRGSVSASELNT